MIIKKDGINKMNLYGFMENSFDEGFLSILEMSDIVVNLDIVKYYGKIN